MPLPQETFTQYQSLTQGIGFVELESRAVLRVRGTDAATFLHNFCTNDVRRLEPGRGCEAFFTSVQGKTLAWCGIYRDAEQFTLETAADTGAPLLAHLDKYLLSDEVELCDESATVSEIVIAGEQAESWLAGTLAVDVPQEAYAHVSGMHDGTAFSLRRVPWSATAWLVECASDDRAAWADRLRAAGARECAPDAWHVVRLEHGWPEFGAEITEANLPQEIDRDDTAISFVKGCYLGQETVARLDALGHVNKILRGLKFDGDVAPRPGATLTVGGKEAARITSTAYSPRLEAPLAIAYVRRGHEPLGTLIESEEYGAAEVVKLPLVAAG